MRIAVRVFRKKFESDAAGEFGVFGFVGDAHATITELLENSKALMLYEFPLKHWTEIAHGNFISTPFWSADAKHVYFQDVLESGEHVYRFRPEDSSLKRVYSFED